MGSEMCVRDRKGADLGTLHGISHQLWTAVNTFPRIDCGSKDSTSIEDNGSLFYGFYQLSCSGAFVYEPLGNLRSVQTRYPQELSLLINHFQITLYRDIHNIDDFYIQEYLHEYWNGKASGLSQKTTPHETDKPTEIPNLVTRIRQEGRYTNGSSPRSDLLTNINSTYKKCSSDDKITRKAYKIAEDIRLTRERNYSRLYLLHAVLMVIDSSLDRITSYDN